MFKFGTPNSEKVIIIKISVV